jgi:chorismate--pyruvate lyase
VKNPYAPSTAPLLPLDLWAPGTELLRALPPPLREWLSDAGPVTARIEAASGCAPTERVLEQRLGFLTREQQALLEAPATGCLVRDALLSARGRPWLFSQALIPDHTLELHPWLAELGDASLAATFAAVAGLERGAFEFAPLPISHPLAARALAGLAAGNAVTVWARRAWLGLRGRRLLLQEVFLPELVPC